MAQYQRTDRGAGDAAALFDDELPEAEVEIEIEDEDDGPSFIIVDGEAVEIEPGGIGDISPEAEPDWNANLAELIDDQELSALGSQLINDFDVDHDARSEWYDTYQKGLDLVGLKIEERTLPWKDACGVFHPVLAEALIRYVSEAALELFPAQGPASFEFAGSDDAALRKRGKRVKDELNYQLKVKMPESRDALEMTLFRQALAGSCFRKTYYDPLLKRPVQRMVPADYLIMSYNTTTLETSNRYTHWMAGTSKNDIKKLQNVGFYREVDLFGTPSPSASESQEKIDDLQGVSKPFELDETCDLLEMYVDIDLPGFEHKGEDGEPTGIKLPHIVTLDKETGTILSIYRNYDEEEPFIKSRTYFSQYKFSPGFGPYGLGLIHILGGVTDAATSLLRQLVDAGTMNNIPSGFKSRNLRIKGDDGPLRPGELRDIDLPPGMLSKSIEWVPTKEPSATLLTLLGALVDEARRVGSLSDMKIGEAGGANAPVGTTLAMIERHTRVISAVGARNYRSMDQELRALKDIIADDMPPEYDYPMEGGPFNRNEDFSSTSIIPVADPSGSTMSQRIMRLTAVETIASKQPQYYDMAFLHRTIVETMDVPHPEKIVPLPDEFVPIDPVSENVNILMMRPVKAFLDQDHESHIKVHMAAMQDPKMAQIVGQGPNAAAIQSAAMAHIQEHVALAYRAKVQTELGVALPPPGSGIGDQNLENVLARASAIAADRVLQRNTAEQQAAMNQQAQQDPMIQLRQKELAIKEMEAQIKLLGIQAKTASDAEKVKILAQKEQMEAQIALAELQLQAIDLAIKAMSTQTQSELGKKQADADSALNSLRMAMDSMNKSEDRNERRESAERASKAKTGASKKPRGKPSNK